MNRKGTDPCYVVGREADSAICVPAVNALWVKQIVVTSLLIQKQFCSISAESWSEPHWSRQRDLSSQETFSPWNPNDVIMRRRPVPVTVPANQRQLGLMPPADRKWEQRSRKPGVVIEPSIARSAWQKMASCPLRAPWKMKELFASKTQKLPL